MANTTVKICGLQSLEIIESMIDLPIDQIGFIFTKSKRRVTAMEVKPWVDFLRINSKYSPLIVGVFVNPTEKELSDVMSEITLDVVQLHGEESASFCLWAKQKFNTRICKVFTVERQLDKDGINILLDPYANMIDSLLLDTYDPIIGGGTGKTFVWESIKLYKEWTTRHQIPIIVAGGLNSSNIKELLENHQPDGVDISSGVETNGMKDIKKIIEFTERVKRS